MDFENIKLDNYYDLVKLPWFEKNGDGRIQIKPEMGVPPILDAHTHLGWSYFMGGVIDYQKLTSEAEHLYNYMDSPFDLEKDEHPTKAEAGMMTRDIALIPFRCPPIGRTQTAINLLHDMDLFNTIAAVSLPVEIPLRSRHAYQTVVACKPHERLIAFAGVHPWTRFKKLRLDWQQEQGAMGMKYHPEFQFNPPDTKGAIDLFSMCAERGLPVLAHSGSTGSEPKWMQNLSRPDRYREALKNIPALKLILGHSGIHNYDEAIKVANDFPEQVWLETSGEGMSVIRKILNKYDVSRVVYGSDWTFFPLGVPIARSMAALEGYPQEVKEGYFFRNMVDLLDLDENGFLQSRIIKNNGPALEPNQNE
jgi:hypothetical protein